MRPLRVYFWKVRWCGEKGVTLRTRLIGKVLGLILRDIFITIL